MNKYRVYLRIHDFDVDCKIISNILNIEFSKSWNKGDIIEGRSIPIYRNQSTWELKSQITEDNEIINHIGWLLDKIKDKHINFLELTEKYFAELSVIIETKNDYNPGFQIDKSTLKKLADMNVQIDFDIYLSV